MRSKIKKFLKERDKMLKKCDIYELRKFINDHPEEFGEHVKSFVNNCDNYILEATMHKMIVNVPKMPRALRARSAFWLALHRFNTKTQI